MSDRTREDVLHLDHAASTPLRPEASEVLTGLRAGAVSANASATHASGRAARARVERGRELAAAALGVSPHDVVMTSGGTESDNLAVKGFAWAGARQGRRHVVTTAIEHPAVLEAARWLATQGFEVTEVAPRPDGTVAADDVLAAVRDDTAVVSVMAANNETGAVNDVAAVVAGVHDTFGGDPRTRPAIHTDAVQAFATCDVRPDEWGVDACSLSAHKFGGPQGVGVLQLRRGVPVEALLHGGGQDRDIRSGTFATALVEACGVAMDVVVRGRDEERVRLAGLRERLATVLDMDRDLRLVRTTPASRSLASHLHVVAPGVDGEALAFLLDRAGLEVSTGSACSAGSARASGVMRALQAVDPERVDGAPIRFSLGWTSTAADVDAAATIVREAVARLRETPAAIGAGGDRG